MPKLLYCVGCKHTKPIEDMPIHGGPGPMRRRGVCRECCKNHQNREKFQAQLLLCTETEARIEHEELKTAIAELGGPKAVANRFGIPYHTVQNWYRGERTPPEYVARIIVLFNADEIERLETKRKNEDLIERCKTDRKRYIEDQKALRWYDEELKGHNEELGIANERIKALQKQLDEAIESAESRLRAQKALEMEVCELRETIKVLTEELEEQNKGRKGEQNHEEKNH